MISFKITTETLKSIKNIKKTLTNILFIIIMLANHFNIISNKICQVEFNTNCPIRLRSPLVCIFFTNVVQTTKVLLLSYQQQRETNFKLQLPHLAQSHLLISQVPKVPDLAMVPKFLIKSTFVIPIPLSRIERILFSLFNFICISSIHNFKDQSCC